MHAEFAYLFRHALLRAAAYELQPPGERAMLHAVALTLLEDVLRQTSGEAGLDAAADDLARHAGAARLGCPTEQAASFGHAEIGWLKRAAKHAKGMSMQRRRLGLWRTVRAHPHLPAEEMPATDVEVARALVDSGLTTEATEMFAELVPVLEASGAVKQVLECKFLYAQALQSGGDTEQAEALAAGALAHCAELQLPDITSRLQTVLLRCWRVRGLWDQALAALPGMIHEARSRSDTRQVVNFLCLRGSILNDVGRLREAAEVLAQARAVSEQADNEYLVAFCRGLEGLTLRDIGESQSALEPIRQACRYFQTVGDARLEANFLGGLSAALYNVQKFDESRDVAARSRDLARESGNKREVHTAHSLIGSCFLRQHDYERAAEHYALSASLAEEMQDYVQAASHRMKLAVARLALGNHADFTALTRQAMATLEAAGGLTDIDHCIREQRALIDAIGLDA